MNQKNIFYIILGAAGSGKSTFIKTLTGIPMRCVFDKETHKNYLVDEE
jgi:ABC-type lipoprotein export system ATPase subunit